MRLLSWISATILLFSLNASAQNNEFFRTPAKLYAGAYTLKVQFKKDFTEYDVPMWVKPDQAESSIDASLLKDLGYEDKEIVFHEVKISGERIEKKKYKNQKTEWAFVPDFAKACCFGVIGRDILEDFEIRFVPLEPTHIEWTRIISRTDLPKYKPAFLNDLKKLFSLHQPLDVPYKLNLQERKLEFEGKIVPSAPALFSFFFIPPNRELKVTGILPKYSASAKKAGFTAGLVITQINDQSALVMDRWVIEKFLRGEKGSTLRLTTDKNKEYVFDFTSQVFKVEVQKEPAKKK